jgi:hypothetical protein
MINLLSSSELGGHAILWLVTKEGNPLKKVPDGPMKMKSAVAIAGPCAASVQPKAPVSLALMQLFSSWTKKASASAKSALFVHV